MDNWDWLDKALCKSQGDDFEVDFFSEDEFEVELAKAICAECPVKRECITKALENQDRFGVWGGADENEIRRALGIDQYGKPASRLRSVRCPLCKSAEVATVEQGRTHRNLVCRSCDLAWTARVPANIVKIDVEDTEEDDDSNNDEQDVEFDIQASS